MVFDGETPLMLPPALAVITARGGSSRVPRKNIRLFCGRPMVAWPTRAACTSGLFQRVVISTDDEEIAAAAQAEGAERPFARPPELADAHSTTADVLRHALQTLQCQTGSLPPWCCCLYGTSALVTPAMLHRAAALAQKEGTELVMAVTPYSHPIERGLTLDDSGLLRYLRPECVSMRTQDFTPVWHDAGLLYWFSVPAFLSEGGHSFAPLQKRALPVSALEAVDIDTQDDWEFAEIVARYRGLDA